jgi:SPP1 gp7 family putative phage head morphogenesis protein
MFERIKQAFASKPPDKDGKPPQGEIGWFDSQIYNALKDFTAYNPDELLRNKGYGIYRKMMMDDQVKSMNHFKRQAVISRKYYFDVDEDKPEHEEIADFFGHTVNVIKGSFKDNLFGILSGLNNGFSITEIVYAPIQYDGRAYWGIKALKLRPFDSFEFKVDGHGNIQKTIQRIGAQEYIIPQNKLIHFVYQADVDDIYGESDLRACYRNWWSKDILIKFQNIHLERHASGFLHAKVKGGLTDKQQSDLQNLINNVSAKMGAITPEMVELLMVQPVKTDAYEAAIGQHDKAIAKSMLVPNLLGLSEQSKHGSRALGDTQMDGFFWVLDFIASSLEEALNEQLFRPLAMWNFGTDDFPRFTFEPISDDQKIEIAKTWADMVQKGAATKTDADENHSRQLMGYPDKPEDKTEGLAVNPAAALNGAQVTALLDIIAQVTAGALPKTSAVQVITNSFPLSTEQAEEMLKDIEEKEPEPEDKPIEDEPEITPDMQDWIAALDPHKKETVLKEFAEKPWTKRVNFQEIETGLDKQDEQYTDEFNEVLAKVSDSIDAQVVKITGDRSLGNVKPVEYAEVRIPKKLLSDMRKVNRNNLKETFDNQYSQARSELPKKFRIKAIKAGMDKTQAERYLTSKTFTTTNNYDENVMKIVNNTLQNSIKFDKTLAQTVAALETDLAEWLPRTDAVGRAVNIPHRLETIVRTNTSDAMNQARTALFNEPEFKGFVEAFEYSAILDERTTEICEHLNGKILKEFEHYTPPNHMNCRSLLIPVTINDEWDGKESPTPRIEPQKGFG